MSQGLNYFGVHFCPGHGCFCNREFVSYEENHRDAKFAECFFCGYRFGEAVDEHVINPETGQYMAVKFNVLSDERVRAAQAKRVEEWRKANLSTGVRAEVLRGR